MKKISFLTAAFAIAASALVATTSCNKAQNNSNEASQASISAPEETYLTAVNRYLTDEIGKSYAPGEICIPCARIVDVDEQNPEDIQVWGDFWVFNYNVSGDTLKTVSGGSHPGLMHIRKADNTFEVTAFDQVADGAGNLESAKKIFGDRFEKFQKMNSDEKAREEDRARLIADYVKSNNLTVKCYQDYGWPAVNLQ
uniref:Lipoprotein n=1 Tax=uncultured bacterium 34R1 TaxID=581113 RepID=C0K020_9BACT|nr:hypothetical protein CLOSS21_02223 [uncultured bacterium 34R1]